MSADQLDNRRQQHLTQGVDIEIKPAQQQQASQPQAGPQQIEVQTH